MTDILDVKQTPLVDTSIERYEEVEVLPVNGASNLNATGSEIRFDINMKDDFYHLAEASLEVTGRLVKADGSSYTDADLTTLCNNAVMYLFSQARLQIQNEIVSTIDHPGRVTTMKGMLSYSDDVTINSCQNFCWYLDSSDAADANNAGFDARHADIIKSPTTKGSFNFRVPLKHLFPICEDREAIIPMVAYRLYLKRASDTDAIHRAAAVAAGGKIELSSMSLWMPVVIPSDAERAKLYKVIEDKTKLMINYRDIHLSERPVPADNKFVMDVGIYEATERPRWVLVGFQTNRLNTETASPAIFDNVNLTDAYCKVGLKQYPEQAFQSNFGNMHFARLYDAANKFSKDYYGMDRLEGGMAISRLRYTHISPIIVFDISRQPEKVTSSSIPLQLNFRFSQNVPAGTMAYAAVISDRTLQMVSNGQEIVLVR